MAKKAKVKTAKKNKYMSTAKLNSRIKSDTKKSGHEIRESGFLYLRIARRNYLFLFICHMFIYNPLLYLVRSHNQ